MNHDKLISEVRRAPSFCSNVQDLPNDAHLKVNPAKAATLLVDQEYAGLTTEQLITIADAEMKSFGLSLRANSRPLAIALLKGVVKA